ncbi:hypothetical protein BD410DRAFT_784090 [Rickenella mellea]|uniref:BTB domain-containing protein n=1 Tax=Rickenella mellea TaxID=50990 RepID=A0A4Y7QF80_9AGAM|nr:hypothetical protein BD410DRAFT_784090 [Rickenella mellea]
MGFPNSTAFDCMEPPALSEKFQRARTDPEIDEAGMARHPSYYFHMITFLVEGVLFRVPRQYFEQESPVFRTMYSLPQGGDSNKLDGDCDHKPLRLDGVQSADFVQFLRVLYPRSYRTSEKLNRNEWESVLLLADMWDLKKVRDLAIEELTHTPMEIISKIVLAHRFHIDEWRLSAYAMLVSREKLISFEEAERLGWDFTMKIQHVREQVARNTTHRVFCWSCGKATSCYGKGKGNPSALDTMTATLCQVFGDDILGESKKGFTGLESIGKAGSPIDAALEAARSAVENVTIS